MHCLWRGACMLGDVPTVLIAGRQAPTERCAWQSWSHCVAAAASAVCSLEWTCTILLCRVISSCRRCFAAPGGGQGPVGTASCFFRRPRAEGAGARDSMVMPVPTCDGAHLCGVYSCTCTSFHNSTYQDLSKALVRRQEIIVAGKYAAESPHAG